MAHDADKVCPCVSEHRPPYLELEIHHIIPTYLGGPDTPENRTWICSTGHTATHELLRLMLKAGRTLTYRECQTAQPRPVSRYAYDLAALGYVRWLDQEAAYARST